MFGIFGKKREQLKKQIREEVLAELRQPPGSPVTDYAGKYGDDPWVTILSIVDDPEKGARVELDWNDAFIEYLRANGIVGVDDDAVIQKYITMLLHDLAGKEEDDNEFE